MKQTNCDNCANKFKSYVAGMFTDQTYCQFCMHYVCSNCIQKVGDVDPASITDGKDGEQSIDVNTSKSGGFISQIMARDDNGIQDPLLTALFFPTTVCKKHYKKLMSYKYIAIDMRNPHL